MIQLQIKINVYNGKHMYTLGKLRDADGYTDEEEQEADKILSSVSALLHKENADLKEAKA